MILLIDKNQVAQKLQVAIGYDLSEYNAFINEAQEFDLKPLVSEDFFFDLLANRSLPAWKKLIDGGNYDFNGRTYHFQGLSTVLSYFSYARFVMSSSAVSTSHGMVVKTTPNSVPLDLEERKNFYYKKRTEANMLFQDCIKHIERNADLFPSFFDKSCTPKNTTGFSTRVIK
jgi:hypothetical protein